MAAYVFSHLLRLAYILIPYGSENSVHLLMVDNMRKVHALN